MNNLSKFIIYLCLLTTSEAMRAIDIKSYIMLKEPGNKSVTYQLTEYNGKLVAMDKTLPVEITWELNNNGKEKILCTTIKALKKVYFNFGLEVPTEFATNDCDFYMPGFWYHKNLRSPQKAPSFYASKSWNVREDRLSSPITGVFDNKTGESLTVARKLDKGEDALTVALDGEVILSGKTSIGYLGFNNETGKAKLTFGYPYIETPKRYIRKLTLTPAIYTFEKLNPGESKSITWIIYEDEAKDFGQYVCKTWTKSFDLYKPIPLPVQFTGEEVKTQLTNYFHNSFVERYKLKFNSGISLRTSNCIPASEMEIGFCGRVLLNAFNEIEYGWQHSDNSLVIMGNKIFQSFLDYGFTDNGFIYDHIWYDRKVPYEDKHSIRQQSEAIYAVLHFLKYEKDHGRKHPEWDKKVISLLNNFVKMQNIDGSFARKFKDNGTIIDSSGGSTPSATVPLIMAYKYYGIKKYFYAAKRTIDYLEKNIISKSDYFSSTLDANCEDKEAAISAVTATYYMTLVSKGKERQHYLNLCKQAAYFALSWYYLWDVPFSEGQMLGDLNFKSRGWGNVSVENNHIDVFVFEFPSILNWLGKITGEKRFTQMYQVIYSSLNQLLPTKDKLCGISTPGFYPEVVQHTTWDYGKNGKGFYNTYFAPGWTTASLWELYSPDRTTNFFK